jgi:hypothetical protein
VGQGLARTLRPLPAPRTPATPPPTAACRRRRRFLSQPRKPLQFNRYFEAAHEAERLQRQLLREQSRAQTQAALAPAFAAPDKRREGLRADVRARAAGGW